ncbi:unnamed protein product [Schistosoma curassoni]|uniref:beta-N-acetylhexosaminidase n=1 Tax=Schistosoma curassoni TaxID=6186 RepID=A0A183K254_9TREM|nr:unnamed protein product [Schistosoma curassoni]
MNTSFYRCDHFDKPDINSGSSSKKGVYYVSKCHSIVPKAYKHHKTGIYHNLIEVLTYNHSYKSCYLLTEALKRFEERLTLIKQYPKVPIYLPNSTIDTIKISITKGCNESNGELWPSESINETCGIIWDEPSFPHRGFLIDTSRHYLSLKEIEKFLDSMSMVKMNVLHWHIVDDQSFPYVSETFPKLSSKGAFHPYLLIYTPNDVKYLSNYARLRGIRIMPEFDTPGHANSWGKGYPEILTKCYIKGEPDGTLGPINPINNISYNFISQLYKELFSVFPDNWFHLGGDEVEYNCWRSNPSVIEFMKQMKFGDDYHRLEGYYINNLIQIINDVKPPRRNITPVVWQEIFENGFRGDKSTVIHVWKDLYWESVVKNATKTGYRVLFSAAWYLNYISYGDDWRYHYHVDPREFGGSKDDAKLVIGGEAAMWGEYVDDTNLFSRSCIANLQWNQANDDEVKHRPRGSAVAERLWTHGSPNTTDFIPRVEELRCRMLS